MSYNHRTTLERFCALILILYNSFVCNSYSAKAQDKNVCKYFHCLLVETETMVHLIL